MGTRIKVFDATGVAPNGRLYAGDLNAIEDQYADQSNYGQEVDVAALGVGESALKLTRYGTGEARLSGAMRIDGIFRGLGGLYAGAFTTTQRDAIALGSRPYGLLILNTTTNQYEWNKGSDTTPAWTAMSSAMVEVAVGMVSDWPWAAGSIPSWAVLPFGQAISRTTYATLSALATAAGFVYGNGDGSTTFNVPDMRGRVALGKDDMGGTAANRITVGISGIAGASLGAVGGLEGITLTTGQIPAHNHTVTDPQHTHGDTLAFTARTDAGTNGGTIIAQTDRVGTTDTPLSKSGGVSSALTGITIQNTGGGGVHVNVQPSLVVNKIMRAL